MTSLNGRPVQENAIPASVLLRDRTGQPARGVARAGTPVFAGSHQISDHASTQALPVHVEMPAQRSPSAEIRPDSGSSVAPQPSPRGWTDPRDDVSDGRKVDRLGVLWAAKAWIFGAVAVFTGLTAALSVVIPAVYSSSVEVVIKVPSMSQDSLLAANSLASQYTEVVAAPPVIEPAAAAVHVPSDELAAKTSGGTVAGQNLIRVTVQWSNPDTARAATSAVAESLVAYINTQTKRQVDDYQKSITAQLAPLDKQIADTQTRVTQVRKEASTDKGGTALVELTAAQSLLSTLTERRAALASQASLQGAGTLPDVQVVGAAKKATKVQPQPLLYSLAAAAASLFLACQTALLLANSQVTRRLRFSRRGRR